MNEILTIYTGDRTDPDNSVGLETWTPGGTINMKCLQWKLHSLDTPPTLMDKGQKSINYPWNGTSSWNETTLGRLWNETNISRLWNGTTFKSRRSGTVVAPEQWA